MIFAISFILYAATLAQCYEGQIYGLVTGHCNNTRCVSTVQVDLQTLSSKMLSNNMILSSLWPTERTAFQLGALDASNGVYYYLNTGSQLVFATDLFAGTLLPPLNLQEQIWTLALNLNSSKLVAGLLLPNSSGFPVASVLYTDAAGFASSLTILPPKYGKSLSRSSPSTWQVTSAVDSAREICYIVFPQHNHGFDDNARMSLLEGPSASFGFEILTIDLIHARLAHRKLACAASEFLFLSILPNSKLLVGVVMSNVENGGDVGVVYLDPHTGGCKIINVDTTDAFQAVHTPLAYMSWTMDPLQQTLFAAVTNGEQAYILPVHAPLAKAGPLMTLPAQAQGYWSSLFFV